MQLGAESIEKTGDALTHAVRDAASALATLAPHAASLGEKIPEAIRAACENLEDELAKDEIVLAVVGDASMKRALLRLTLGGDAIRGPRAKRERIVRLRAGETFDYEAHKKDGTVLRFARSMPDRDPIYKESIDDAEAHVREAEGSRGVLARSVEDSRAQVRVAEEAIANAEAELEAMGERFADAWRAHRAAEGRVQAIDRTEPDLPAIFKTKPGWWAFWIWIMRWVVASKWRPELAAHAQNRAESRAAHERATQLEAAAKAVESTREDGKAKIVEEKANLVRALDALAAVEVSLSEECAVTVAEAAVEKLIASRAAHAGERKDEFFADLADYDATARGDEIEALDVHLPKTAQVPIPEGLVLVFGEAPKDVDGYVLARDPSDKTPRDADVRERLPCALSLVVRESLKNELPEALARLAAGKHRVVAARFAIAMRACIAELEKARSVAEAQHQRRLAALESQRIPKPAEFRARQVARSEAAIGKGADDVLASALERQHDQIEALRKEWTDRLRSAARKRELDDAIAEINQGGKLRVLESFEATSEHIAREMQSIGETLERWALDEVHTSYRVQKRVRAESLAPVASEVTAEDLGFAVSAVPPAAGAREAFAKQRLRVSVGGASAMAVVGGGVGFAVHHALGAVAFALFGVLVGSLAGRFQSHEPLRAQCLSLVATWLDDVDRKSAALLRGKRGDIESGIRSALDTALADTLERLNEAITRLMTVERNAIEGERATLARLDATQNTLSQHDERLKAALGAFTNS